MQLRSIMRVRPAAGRAGRSGEPQGGRRPRCGPKRRECCVPS